MPQQHCRVIKLRLQQLHEVTHIVDYQIVACGARQNARVRRQSGATMLCGWPPTTAIGRQSCRARMHKCSRTTGAPLPEAARFNDTADSGIRRSEIILALASVPQADEEFGLWLDSCRHCPEELP